VLIQVRLQALGVSCVRLSSFRHGLLRFRERLFAFLKLRVSLIGVAHQVLAPEDFLALLEPRE